jgi:hypothetical protein
MNFAKWVPLGKVVVSWIAGSCVSATTTIALHNIIPPTTLNSGQKLEVGIGTYVISGMAGAVAGMYVQKKLDEILPDFEPAEPQKKRNAQY